MRALHQPATGPSDLRLAELIAALSLATDLGMGQPLEFALCGCVLAVRLGEAVGLDEHTLRDVYYQALLRFVGCNAETYAMSAIVGDEIAFRSDVVTRDTADSSQMMRLLVSYIRQANAGASPLRMVGHVAQHMRTAQQSFNESFAGHCEVAQRLARRLGFAESLVGALGQLYERWDGRGQPHGLKGEAIAPAVRIVAFAQDIITFSRLGGAEAAVAVARDRRATAYDPALVECFCPRAAHLLAGLDEEPSWETVLATEPGARMYLSEEQLDTACEAIADFADIKSPYLLGHSPGVARLAAGAAWRYGLPAPDVTAIRRAGLLHDVGRVGISAGIWGKPGPLTEREWERVRLHTYYTERVLARPVTLARLGALAAHHHERLDGSGYHRGASAAGLVPAHRILAAADMYQALTEPRPHRPARSPDAAADLLRREARAGRLDGEAVDGVLAAAGHRVRPARRETVAGLSDRELEVLRLIARGNSMKQMAGLLSISEKTVDNHIQHIYAKIGVSTRAAATLFAMEQDLLAEAG